MRSEDTTRSSDIRRGLRDTSAAALGLIPLGLAFGLLVAQAGFAWWWAPRPRFGGGHRVHGELPPRPIRRR